MRKILIVSLLFTALACSKSSSVTGPDPIDNSSDSPAITTTPTPSEEFVVPEEPSKNPGPTSVNCQGGVCTFTSTGPHWISAACTAVLQTNDWGRWRKIVNTGDSVTPYDICDPVKIGIDLCEGGSVSVQIDFTAGQGEHIGHLITKLTYAPNEEYCECEPTDWEIISRGEPTEGEVVECPLDVEVRNGQDKCYECYELITPVVESNGCEKRDNKVTSIKKREIECPCEETWLPDEEYTFDHYGEWSECNLGIRTRDVFGVLYETNSCTQERRVKADSEKVIDTEREECATPGLCYYKVSGQGGEVGHKIKCELTFSFQSFTLGTWINFEGEKLDNHCQYPVPGIINRSFNLTPGQSDPSCLNKNDD